MTFGTGTFVETHCLRWSTISPSPHPTADQSPTKKQCVFLFCRIMFPLYWTFLDFQTTPMVKIQVLCLEVKLKKWSSSRRFRHFCRLYNVKFSLSHMAVCQNLVPLVNIKIAGKWMFIPLKMVCIGIDPYPYWDSINPNHWHSSRIHPLGLNNRHRLSKTYVQLPVERLQAHIWPHALCGT